MFSQKKKGKRNVGSALGASKRREAEEMAAAKRKTNQFMLQISPGIYMYKGFCGRFQEDYKVYGQHLFYSVQTFIEITVKIVWRSSMLREATAKNSKQME